MLEAPGRLLPRPMSLCLAPPGELAFLIDPIGPGTRALCALEPGDELRVLGPLGNGFHLDVERPLLVGGGIGVAPLPYLSERARRARRRCSASAARGTPRRPRSSRTPRSSIEPTLVTELLPDDGHDVLACGPEPMLEAVARLAPGAQLAWEAPMACGYGACYGCAVEIDGELQAPLRRGPGAACGWPDAVILNASGCLDALTAPDVARQLDAFVTKTVTPLPREGNAPVADRRDRRTGCSTRSGSRTPASSASSPTTLPRLRELGVPLWVSVGGFSAREYARDLRAARRDDVEAIELNLSCPNVDEAPETRRRDRRRLPRGDRAAALREALAGRVGHRRGRARRRGRRRRRPLARQHDPRPRARRAHAAAAARAGRRRLLGPGAEADRARRRPRVPPRDRAADRRHGRRRDRPRRARPDRLPARAPSRSGPSSSPTRTRPTRIRDELAAEAAAHGFASPADARGVAHDPVPTASVELSRRRKIPGFWRKRYRLTAPAKLLVLPRHGAVQDPGASARRSLDQRMEALKRANDIRVKRAQLKKDLKAGAVQIEES